MFKTPYIIRITNFTFLRRKRKEYRTVMKYHTSDKAVNVVQFLRRSRDGMKQK